MSPSMLNVAVAPPSVYVVDAGRPAQQSKV